MGHQIPLLQESWNFGKGPNEAQGGERVEAWVLSLVPPIMHMYIIIGHSHYAPVIFLQERRKISLSLCISLLCPEEHVSGHPDVQ